MDILVSSNLERFIFELTGRNSKETNAHDFSKKKTEATLFQIQIQLYSNNFTETVLARRNGSNDSWCIHERALFIRSTHAVADAVYTKYKKKQET